MIRISVFDDMTLCTDAEVERMIPSVPEPRRSQALAFKHTFGRFACLKSYLMLAELLQSEFGLEKFDIEVGEHGKPYLAGHQDIHFNISHCQNAIAVAVSDRPVGIDVESFRNFNDGLVDKTMNDLEKSEIISSAEPRETFAAYWTRKEAVFKLIGTGITDNLHGILTDKTRTDTIINREKGYAASVAVYSADGLDQLFWL
ncbi:MAG: 4'-phosphopantetheinyl transferase superfamily protein [Bacteroidaceae bacterium]|nr:4'-phosphopantetheinyl transferase superfamily protein [Bacteroidaceae bacterium]